MRFEFTNKSWPDYGTQGTWLFCYIRNSSILLFSYSSGTNHWSFSLCGWGIWKGVFTGLHLNKPGKWK